MAIKELKNKVFSLTVLAIAGSTAFSAVRAQSQPAADKDAVLTALGLSSADDAKPIPDARLPVFVQMRMQAAPTYAPAPQTAARIANPYGTIDAAPTTRIAVPAPAVSGKDVSPWSIEAGAFGAYMPNPRANGMVSSLMNKMPSLQQITSAQGESYGAQMSVKYKINDTWTLVMTAVYAHGTMNLVMDESVLVKNTALAGLAAVPTGFSFSVPEISNLPAPVKNLLAAYVVPAVTDNLSLKDTLTQLTSPGGLTYTAPAIPLSAVVQAATSYLQTPIYNAINNSNLPAAEKTALINGLQPYFSNPALIFNTLQTALTDTNSALTAAKQDVTKLQNGLTGVNGRIQQTGADVITGVTAGANAAAAIDTKAAGTLGTTSTALGTAAATTVGDQAVLNTLTQNFLKGVARNLPAKQGNELAALGGGLTATATSTIGGSILSSLQGAQSVTQVGLAATGGVQTGINTAKQSTGIVASLLSTINGYFGAANSDLTGVKNGLTTAQNTITGLQSTVQQLANSYNTAKVQPGSLNVRIVNSTMAGDINTLNSLLPAANFNTQQLAASLISTGKGNVALPANFINQVAANLAQKFGSVKATSQSDSGIARLGFEVHPLSSFRALSFGFGAGVGAGSGSLAITSVSVNSATYSLGKDYTVTGTGIMGYMLANYGQGSLPQTMTVPEFKVATKSYNYKSLILEGTAAVNLDLFSAYNEIVNRKEADPYSPSLVASVGFTGGVQKVMSIASGVPVHPSLLPDNNMGFTGGLRLNIPLGGRAP